VDHLGVVLFGKEWRRRRPESLLTPVDEEIANVDSVDNRKKIVLRVKLRQIQVAGMRCVDVNRVCVA